MASPASRPIGPRRKSISTSERQSKPRETWACRVTWLSGGPSSVNTSSVLFQNNDTGAAVNSIRKPRRRATDWMEDIRRAERRAWWYGAGLVSAWWLAVYVVYRAIAA